MLVTWDPEDGSEQQSWDFDPGDVPFSRVKQIEQHYGKGYDTWKVGLMSGEVFARGVLLWYMLTLVHPKLQFKDLPDFRVRQLTVTQGTRELLDLQKRVAKMRLSDEDRERFDLQFEVEMQEAMEREGIEGTAEVVDGKLAIEASEEVERELPKHL